MRTLLHIQVLAFVVAGGMALSSTLLFDLSAVGGILLFGVLHLFCVGYAFAMAHFKPQTLFGKMLKADLKEING